jgi:thymidylate kinase
MAPAGTRPADEQAMLVVVVGPCGSGKTTLVARLQTSGYAARAVAQEHSQIDELWKHGGMPDALIFLDASPAMITRRRQNEFPQWLYAAQTQRLRSAREHATLYLHTDRLSPGEVQRRVVDHLRTLTRQIAAE